MKSITLTLLIVLTTFAVKAQIPNPGMENWTNTSGSIPAQWSSNGKVSKVSGHNGSAVKLESDIQRQNIGAVLYGHAQNNNLGGGFAYSSKPDSFVGYFMYDVKPGDTAYIVLILQKSSIPISMDKVPITGTQTSGFQRIAFKINYLAPFTPDTIFLGITSGNPFSNNVYDSYVIADDLSFTGSTGAIPNGNFETWNTVSFDMPNGWAVQNDFNAQPVQKSTDKYSGNYAIKIQNIFTNTDNRQGLAETAGPHTGQYNMFGPMPAFPVSTKPDTLFCWTKFAPQNGDSATITVQLFNHGNPLGFGQTFLGPMSSYTLTKVPIHYFNGGLSPDSAVIQLASFQLANNSNAKGTSTLYVDNLSFDKVVTGIAYPEEPKTFYLYPNPTSDKLNIQFEDWQKVKAINITDMNGRLILHQDMYTKQIDIQNFEKGVYFISIVTTNASCTQKFIRY
jgi:hypothetical protein